MFIAHAPVGYLIGTRLSGPLGRWAGPLPALVPVSVAGALAPDLDLLLWLADRSVHHHAWPTHWPLAWAALACGIAPMLRWPALRARAVLALAFAGNGLLHQVLDTLVGDIRWLAPFDQRALALFVVQRIHEPWWLNFLLHPSFLVELGLTAAAGLAWWHRRRA